MNRMEFEGATPKERKSISFNHTMINSILNGTKKQTRRVVDFSRLSNIKKGRLFYSTTFQGWAIEDKGDDPKATITMVDCPYGKIGDTIFLDVKPNKEQPSNKIKIIIKRICIERLQGIKKEDAISEGIESRVESCGESSLCNWYKNYLSNDGEMFCSNPIASFESLWDSIYQRKKGKSWKSNPFVWVIAFEVLK